MSFVTPPHVLTGVLDSKKGKLSASPSSSSSPSLLLSLAQRSEFNSKPSLLLIRKLVYTEENRQNRASSCLSPCLVLRGQHLQDARVCQCLCVRACVRSWPCMCVCVSVSSVGHALMKSALALLLLLLLHFLANGIAVQGKHFNFLGQWTRRASSN